MRQASYDGWINVLLQRREKEEAVVLSFFVVVE